MLGNAEWVGHSGAFGPCLLGGVSTLLLLTGVAGCGGNLREVVGLAESALPATVVTAHLAACAESLAGAELPVVDMAEAVGHLVAGQQSIAAAPDRARRAACAGAAHGGTGRARRGSACRGGRFLPCRRGARRRWTAVRIRC